MTIKNLLRERLVKVLSGPDTTDEGTLSLSSLNLADLGKGLGISVLSGILGMSGAIFSSHPLGIAFLCACSGKYAAYSYIGLLVSSLASRGMALALAITYTVTLLLRYGASRFTVKSDKTASIPIKERIRKAFSLKSYINESGKLFSEGLPMRVCIASFSALIFGLYRLIGGGFLYYDLFGLLAGFLLTPIITAALSGLFIKSLSFEYSREIAVATLGFITVYALCEHTVFGFSPALAAAFFITIWAGSAAGGLKGCAVGLLAGLACSNAALLADTSLLGIIPCLMAFAGLSQGILKKLVGNIAVLPTLAVVGALGWALGGFEIIRQVIPDMLSASVIFLPLSKYKILPKISHLIKPREVKITDDTMLLAKKEADSRQRISALSDAFSKLSETVYFLSDCMRRPGVVDLKQVCDKAFGEFCQRCALASVCLEKEYMSTLDAQGKITSALYKNGRAELSDVPGYLRNRCHNISLILEEMNHSAAKLVERLIKNDRTEAFAVDYEIMSKLLAARIAENEEEYKVDTDLTKKLSKSLGYMNLSAERAICFGKRKKQIIVGDLDVARVHLGAQDIQTAVENTLGIAVEPPTFTIDGESTTMYVSARRKYKIESATAAATKAREKANGDNTAVFTNKDDFGYAIISDGMGSGKEAAVTSKICSVFAERMLGAGNGVAITLEMLNAFIRNRGVECSATVDLAEIDLINGNVSFIKSGAAPSFVLRQGNIYKLESKTMPIGIMADLDAEKIKFDLEAEDVIVMLSDGIAASLEDGVWLANLLTYEWEDNLQNMADKILEVAAVESGRADDMTVILIRIMENGY